jgi:hypothetical protein
VPRVQGDDLRRHLIDQGPLGEIVYDPVAFDTTWQANWSLCSMHAVGRMRKEAARVLPKAVEHAVT